jgi:putative transposase
MPRQARIDAPGALHHIIVRGIERTTVFVDDIDRKNFLERLSRHLSESQTACFAWALMTNRAHLLLRTGRCPIASIMRRLLTGYAVSFNRRHSRHWHFFQNRYKSILCEEDAYLRQLVAYIHLNALRTGIVDDLSALKAYPFTGHSALMGRKARPWQDTRYVLALFGRGLSEARRITTACVQVGLEGPLPRIDRRRVDPVERRLACRRRGLPGGDPACQRRADPRQQRICGTNAEGGR